MRLASRACGSPSSRSRNRTTDQNLNVKSSIPTRQRGVTLIELLVTLAVVAIIAAIAWPAYERHNMKQRRTEAVVALTKVSAELQRHFSDNLTYEDYEVSDGITDSLRHYNIAVELAAKTYTVTATAIGRQADDADCTSLSLDQVGRKSYTGDAPTAARCWGSN